MDKTQDRILRPAEAAERLSISVRTLGRLAATQGGIRKIQLSARRIGFRESDLSSFIERNGCS